MPIKAIKILVTGTFESGKTTLLEQFTSDPKAIIIPEVARDLLRGNPKLELEPNFQDLVFSEQIAREREAEFRSSRTGASIILCDRGVLDILAFSEVLGHPLKNEWIEAAIKRYDIAVILSKDDIASITPIPELELDPEVYRNNVDTSIRKVLELYSPGFIEIDGTVAQRAHKLSDILRELTHNPEGNLRHPEKR